MKKTTIQLNQNTLERLKSLKRFERESYDEVLNILLNEIEEETLTNKEIKEIQQALEEVKKGKVYPIEIVAKKLSISLK